MSVRWGKSVTRNLYEMLVALKKANERANQEPIGLVLPGRYRQTVLDVYGRIPDNVKFSYELNENTAALQYKQVFVDEVKELEPVKIKHQDLISNPFIQCPSQGYGRARR